MRLAPTFFLIAATLTAFVPGSVARAEVPAVQKKEVLPFVDRELLDRLFPEKDDATSSIKHEELAMEYRRYLVSIHKIDSAMKDAMASNASRVGASLGMALYGQEIVSAVTQNFMKLSPAEKLAAMKKQIGLFKAAQTNAKQLDFVVSDIEGLAGMSDDSAARSQQIQAWLKNSTAKLGTPIPAPTESTAPVYFMNRVLENLESDYDPTDPALDPKPAARAR
jgi:hypothetical protein